MYLSRYNKICLRILLACSWLFLLSAQCRQPALPGKEQLDWADAEIGVFIDLDINIYAPDSFRYADRSTLPDVNRFNPTRLDTDQWIRTAQAGGAKYAILTVKHGTGFCLWPSKVNHYNVGYTSWRNGHGDILAEFIASCKKYGIKPGIYYNTHTNTYYDAGYKPFTSDSSQKAYNRAVLLQLDEIWRNYGGMFEIWFDGGITVDSRNGIETDLVKMIHAYQPRAILFQGPIRTGHTIRWVGNEDGIAPYPQWSTADISMASDGSGKTDDPHGSADGRIWCPAESDFPIRKNNAWNGGWLWKAGEEGYLYNVNQLTEKYYNSVGRNTNMLVGLVVDTSGLIPKKDSMVFDSLGKNIKGLFDTPVASVSNSHQKIIELTIPAHQLINQVLITEDQTTGEHIRSYVIEAFINKKWALIAVGQSIGHKRIQVFNGIAPSKMRLVITQASGDFDIKELTFYKTTPQVLL